MARAVKSGYVTASVEMLIRRKLEEIDTESGLKKVEMIIDTLIKRSMDADIQSIRLLFEYAYGKPITPDEKPVEKAPPVLKIQIEQ